MKDGTEPTPVTSPDDPRLAGMGMDDVAGADQIDGMLAMTPDDRLDSLVAMADFAEQLRHGRIISSKRQVSFEPRELFRILNAHGVRYVVIGNLGATLYGSPLVTNDADICPSRDHDNLEALAGALNEMRARIRAPGVPEGLPFACDAVFLGQMKMVNLVTPLGDLDLSFEPSGTGGYGDLSQRSVVVGLRDDLDVPVAALEDIIRSKEAANREKDRMALPTLRLLLQKMKGEKE